MDRNSPEMLKVRQKETERMVKVLQDALGPTTPCICLFRDSTGGVSEVTLNTTDEERRRIGAHLAQVPEEDQNVLVIERSSGRMQ